MLPVPPLSYSSIHAMKLCGMRYWFGYVDPQRKLIKRDSDLTGTLPGHVVHRIAEVALKAADKTKPGVVTDVNLARFEDNKLLYAVFKDFAADPRVSFASREHESLAWAADERTALNYIRHCRDNLFALLQTHDLIQPFMLREWTFGTYKAPLVLNDQLKICGGLDLLTGQSPTSPLRLIDYKATHTDFRLDKDQLKLYQLAAELAGYRVGMTGFLMFKHRRAPIYHAFKKKDLDDAVHDFVRISKKIQAEEFDYTPSQAACGLCDYRDDCPKAIKLDTPIDAPKPTEKIAVPVFEVPEL
jgi:hypothetical protein